MGLDGHRHRLLFLLLSPWSLLISQSSVMTRTNMMSCFVVQGKLLRRWRGTVMHVYICLWTLVDLEIILWSYETNVRLFEKRRSCKRFKEHHLKSEIRGDNISWYGHEYLGISWVWQERTLTIIKIIQLINFKNGFHIHTNVIVLPWSSQFSD